MAASLKQPPFILCALEKQKRNQQQLLCCGFLRHIQGTSSERRALCSAECFFYHIFLAIFRSACTHGRLLWFCIWSVLRVEFYLSHGMSSSVSHVDDKCLTRNSQDTSCFSDHVHRSRKSLACSLEKSKSSQLCYSGGITAFLNSKVWRSRNDLKESWTTAEGSSYSFLSNFACIMCSCV